jgi:hypothetical protein
MYYADLLRTVRRFWYVALAGVVATAALCFLAARVIPPDYQAQAKVLMVPARAPATPGGDNPLLSIGGLQPTADTLALAFADTTVQERLAKEGVTGKYEVVLDPVSKSPVLAITATDSSPAAALATLKLVVGEVPKVLADLQGKVDVPVRSQLSTLVIAQDQKATLVLKSRIRLLGAVGGVGLAVTFGLMVFLFNRDRQRNTIGFRRSAPPSAPSGPATTALREPLPSWARGSREEEAVPAGTRGGRLDRPYGRDTTGTGRGANGRGTNGRGTNGRDLNGRDVVGRDMNGRDVNDRDVVGRDVVGRDVNGRDVVGRDLVGRDMNGRDVVGRDVVGRDVVGRDVNGRGVNGRGAGAGNGRGSGGVPDVRPGAEENEDTMRLPR